MSDIHNRVEAFVKLGSFLGQFSTKEIKRKDSVLYDDFFFDEFIHLLKITEQHNQWFTKDNLLFACEGWSELLTRENISEWLAEYDLDKVETKTVAIIMAGNIPMVGFHDFLCTLICGHRVLVKLSSNDKLLLPFLAKYLEFVEPGFKGNISFTEEKLEGFDAVIATGSNNTARYFEYYFGKKPNIIRKNRNSVAVLTGKESEAELSALGEDIFRYFGLGCRSVSKLYVPEGYDFDSFFKAIYSYSPVIDYVKYANNYDYNKAVYLMSLFKLKDNGFLMLKEDSGYASPIATVFYEFYSDLEEMKSKLQTDNEMIQCIVGKGLFENEIQFGNTQRPGLRDYADNVDTVSFLLEI